MHILKCLLEGWGISVVGASLILGFVWLNFKLVEFLNQKTHYNFDSWELPIIGFWGVIAFGTIVGLTRCGILH